MDGGPSNVRARRAFDFYTDMVELSVSTLGKLVDIQLSDLSTIVEHQNVSMRRITEVRNVVALLTLQREYREGFWKDRADALTTAKNALQVASQQFGKSWTEMVNAYATSPTPSGVPGLRDAKSRSKQRAKRSKNAKEAMFVAAVPTSRTPKIQMAPAVDPTRKISAPRKGNPRPEQAATRTIPKKRRARARKGEGSDHKPPLLVNRAKYCESAFRQETSVPVCANYGITLTAARLAVLGCPDRKFSSLHVTAGFQATDGKSKPKLIVPTIAWRSRPTATYPPSRRTALRSR